MPQKIIRRPKLLAYVRERPNQEVTVTELVRLFEDRGPRAAKLVAHAMQTLIRTDLLPGLMTVEPASVWRYAPFVNSVTTASQNGQGANITRIMNLARAREDLKEVLIRHFTRDELGEMFDAMLPDELPSPHIDTLVHAVGEAWGDRDRITRSFYPG